MGRQNGNTLKSGLIFNTLCIQVCVCPYVSYIPHIYTSFDMKQLYAEIMAIILGCQHS